jgi:hypothetical protein
VPVVLDEDLGAAVTAVEMVLENRAEEPVPAVTIPAALTAGVTFAQSVTTARPLATEAPAESFFLEQSEADVVKAVGQINS